ncbi:Ftr1 protein [Laetiporus sulphureus 93-53]|uniref:Ftr1 protein n=1 Tax=Laetiporus sulphureus 93-53 TaxID=1314785 RepID=A0A165EYL2_9APHY|nr:Ftr1 protein [Laetiporus sulphureus 93-53]KZT07990.1 Ftr1 protein [Laetiporus sulphureus 93-53]
MGKSVFSVPIFFIVFRETLEAAIIVSVLLGLVEQIVKESDGTALGLTEHNAQEELGDAEHEAKPHSDTASSTQHGDESAPELLDESDRELVMKRLMRKMRLQIFFGSLLGLIIAAAIGAAFIAIWFTQASNLWASTEELWEGIFSVIASLIIFVMGVTMLKMDRAKAKWRIKLLNAFSGKRVDRSTRAGRWVLFILPLITVLREGMEAVVFVGGVSLGQSATAIPIAAIVGFICGCICGYLIYAFASRTTLTIFMVVMTNFILLIGAGLFSRGVWDFQEQHFDNIVGADVDDTGGDGPGSFDVQGNVWHLDCCNPENNLDSDGWSIFNAIFGWTNSATIGSILSYVFYWLAVIVVLIYLKFKEGRTKLLGKESAAGVRRRERQERLALEANDEKASKPEEEVIA